MENHNYFSKLLINSINALGLENVSKLDNLSRMSQNFVVDGVHLTPKSGNIFVSMLLYNAKNFFTTKVINLEDETNMAGVSGLGRESEPGSGQANFEKSVNKLDKKIEDINREIFRRRFNDNLVKARI